MVKGQMRIWPIKLYVLNIGTRGIYNRKCIDQLYRIFKRKPSGRYNLGEENALQDV
jgi:hypothetical protein